MIIKRGNVVSHAGGIEWGVGKVVEVTALKATIQFSDGIIRKIASSHYNILQPADQASFVPIPEAVPVVKKRAAPKKKVIQPAV
jgi:transcription elongation factor GreA-like protein